jgi:hypothetical protein
VLITKHVINSRNRLFSSWTRERHNRSLYIE